MSKIIARLTSDWDTKLLMDSKDFALLCDIVARSAPYKENYCHTTSKYVCVAADVAVDGTCAKTPTIISSTEWEAMLNADKEPEEVES